MRKSKLYETVIEELISVNKLTYNFTKLDLKRLSDIHQKYLVFVYKHSDIKNLGKMTLYFKRVSSSSKQITFCKDETIYKSYCSMHTFG
jgi:hypothetical protein